MSSILHKEESNQHWFSWRPAVTLSQNPLLGLTSVNQILTLLALQHAFHNETMRTSPTGKVVPSPCVFVQLPHCNSVVFPTHAQTLSTGCGQSPHYTAGKGQTNAMVPCDPLQPPGRKKLLKVAVIDIIQYLPSYRFNLLYLFNQNRFIQIRLSINIYLSIYL